MSCWPFVSAFDLHEQRRALSRPCTVLDPTEEQQAAEDREITLAYFNAVYRPLLPPARTDRCHILFNYNRTGPHLWFILSLRVLPMRWRTELGGDEQAIVGISVWDEALGGLVGGKEQQCLLELYRWTEQHWKRRTGGKAGQKREVMICSVEVVLDQLQQTAHDTKLYVRLQPLQATPWSSQPVGSSFGLRLLAHEMGGLWPVEPQPGCARPNRHFQGRVVRYRRDVLSQRNAYRVQLDGCVMGAAALRGR